MLRSSTVLLPICSGLFIAGFAMTGKPPEVDYQKEIFPVLKKFCGGCHTAKDGAGGVSLMAYTSAASFKAHPDHWDKVAKNLASKRMPPAGSPAPTQAQRDKVVKYIRAQLAANRPSTGRVTIRRLNREEYNNTIRDLFGLDLRPAEDFPSDDVGYGFDNIGDVLSMSPLHMEKYMKAAQTVAAAVIYTPGLRKYRVQAAEIEAPNSNPTEEGGRFMYANSEVAKTVTLPIDGEYKLTVAAFQTKAGSENAKMALRYNGKDIEVVEVGAGRGKPQTFETTFRAKAGQASVGAAFINDYYVPKSASSPGEDRNLAVLYLQIEGPIGATGKPPASHERTLIARPTGADWKDAERKVLGRIASRAYRRPVAAAELEKLVAIAELGHKNGESFEKSIQLGITAALCSPNFLFRAETPTDGPLKPYEIATRLSYFLWSSMPDDELFALAAKNELQKPEVLSAQVERMLKDPKARALADNFAGQWLQTRKLTELGRDAKLFPGYTEQMQRDMATETRLFFQNIVTYDLSVLEFIEANYSFVNGSLAQLYGVQGVQGREFKKAILPPGRYGVLTQASVLTVTSNPTRTSPVKRGKWILENILGAPTPPPPPDVGVLKDDQASADAATIRERLEQHRRDPACASCHMQMDGLGFALENFDPVGAYRTKDGRFAIDAFGTLPDGSKFNGSSELRDVLVKRKDQFVRCLAEKMMTYAIGRGMESYDENQIDEIAKQTAKGEYRFSSLINAIVLSDTFRNGKAGK